MKNDHLNRLKDFLDSGTPEAKAAQIALVVLAFASLPALVFIAASMGNAVQVFKQFKTSKHLDKNQIRNSINYLRREKLIEYATDRKGKTMVKITHKGKTKLRDFSIELIKIKKPRTWDRQWRLVMFDIPIRFRKGREALRWHLKELGFYQFQKSAWVYPYSCEDEIDFIADFYGLEKFVDILTISEISREHTLREYFKL